MLPDSSHARGLTSPGAYADRTTVPPAILVASNTIDSIDFQASSTGYSLLLYAFEPLRRAGDIGVTNLDGQWVRRAVRQMPSG